MILTIPGGASQTWGNPILLNVSEIVYPGDAVNPQLFYQVRIKATLEGVLVREAALLPDGFGNASTDIAPFITSPGSIGIEWGEKYRTLLGWVTNWFTEDHRAIEIVNETVIVDGQITIPGGAVQLSGNPIQIIVTTTDEAMAGKTNYKLALKVTCDELMGSPYIEEIAPLALVSKFDISGFVDQPVAFDFDYPAINKVTSHTALSLTVTIDIGEVYIDADGDRQVSWPDPPTSKIIQVLKGKLRPYELALLNEAGKTFNTEYVEGGKFLTHMLQNQKVSLLQEMKLWFLSKWAADTQILLNLEIETDPPYFVDPNDGAVTNYAFQFTDNVLIANALIEFTINPTFMGFDVPPGSHAPAGTKTLAYSFWISNYPGDDEFESEHFRFVVDKNYHEKEFVFYYVNPLSGIDCIRLTGEYVETLPTESEQSYKPIPEGSGTKVASLVTTSASDQRSWEINTGAKTADEMRGLRDFLTSKQIWMVDPERETYKKLIPVYLEPGDNLIFDSMQDIQNFSIKVFEAHK